MSEQELHNLLIEIQESSSSKQWNFNAKKITLSKFKENKDFQNKLNKAWTDKQLREREHDPLEEKVVDQTGQILASRDWRCDAKDCSYKFYRGQCYQLAIEVSPDDCDKLIKKKKYACLKHYIVQGQNTEYCHNYFKANKKLPPGAKLNIKPPKQLAKVSQPQHSNSLQLAEVPQPQPSTSFANKEPSIVQVQKKSVNDGGPRKRPKFTHPDLLGQWRYSSDESDNSLDFVPPSQKLITAEAQTSNVEHCTQPDQADAVSKPDEEVSQLKKQLDAAYKMYFEVTSGLQTQVKDLTLQLAEVKAQQDFNKEQPGIIYKGHFMLNGCYFTYFFLY